MGMHKRRVAYSITDKKSTYKLCAKKISRHKPKNALSKSKKYIKKNSVTGQGVFLSQNKISAIVNSTYNISQFQAQKGANRCIIYGGSRRYHGAPCLAGNAALRGGAEYVYIITSTTTAKEAAICCASPEFIVMNDPDFKDLLSLHPSAIVAGPGLAENAELYTKLALVHGLVANVPVVLDADSIGALAKIIEYSVSDSSYGDEITPIEAVFLMVVDTFKSILQPSFVENFKNNLGKNDLPFVILTPNIRECFALARSLKIDLSGFGPSEFGRPPVMFTNIIIKNRNEIVLSKEQVENLASLVNKINIKLCYRQSGEKVVGVPKFIIIQKNLVDSIVFLDNGKEKHKTTDLVGALRRCAGQGDVLSGLLGSSLGSFKREKYKENEDLIINICIDTCNKMKCVASLAYNKYKDSLVAEDIIEALALFKNQPTSILRKVAAKKKCLINVSYGK